MGHESEERGGLSTMVTLEFSWGTIYIYLSPGQRWEQGSCTSDLHVQLLEGPRGFQVPLILWNWTHHAFGYNRNCWTLPDLVK